MTYLVVIHTDATFREHVREAVASGLPGLDIRCGETLDDVASLVDDVAVGGLVLAEIQGTVRATVSALLPSRRRRPRLRFAIVGERGSRRELQDCIAAGIAGFVLKDLPADRIVAIVRAMLGGAEFVPPSVGGQPIIDPRVRGEARPTPAADPDRLTERQREVLKLVVVGMSNRDIATTLHIAEATVKVHVAAALRTLGIKNRAAAPKAVAALAADPRWAQALGFQTLNSSSLAATA